MLEKLPYPLSEGVTATREGLVVDDEHTHWFVELFWLLPDYATFGAPLYEWQLMAERLRCPLDAPGVVLIDNGADPPQWHLLIANERFFSSHEVGRLSRPACLLFNGPDGFRVIHWCITELGGGDASQT